jgi:hypothetical protein
MVRGMPSSRVQLDLNPPHGVGPVRLGMTVDETRAALATLGDLSGSLQRGLWVHRRGGVGINPGFAPSGRLNAVEIHRPQTQDLDVVRYHDVDVFGLPAQEVVERLQRHTKVIPEQDDDACFTAPDLLLAFWRLFAGDDDPDDWQGYYFNSVLLAEPGFYDTPAEAARRQAATSNRPIADGGTGNHEEVQKENSGTGR